jgi:NADH:ubiquinone oxidoreductase subunit 5 (subunit L)/multisubunit Na+/H+ antiporter MnhA subunit
VLGLTQFRIKRLYAYSTISHVGFVILALSINSVESIQSFFFYLMQYSVSNLNAFIILIAIGFSLYNYTNKNKEYLNLQDKNNSPIQLISQIKGYFYINSILALSLTITLFSFAGIPPLLGFFAKMMILSAALDKGYIFMVLIAIITSVISTVYYLAVIKDMYFSKPENLLINTEYLLNTEFSYTNIDKEEKVQDQESENITTNDENKRANVENRAKLENIVNSYNFYRYIVLEKHNTDIKLEKHNIIDLSPVAREHKETKIPFDSENIVLSSSLTITVSILTLVILLFILRPNE